MARPTARGVRAKEKIGRVNQSPSAAGGEDWVICARARWLATRVAWVSSAECQVAHGTGHGGTHVHGTVWTGRAVGKAFFGSVHVLYTTYGDNPPYTTQLSCSVYHVKRTR